ncbi:phage portal protein family protein [Cellulosimicrobium funkei]|uniref:phage portal protein family protein n=1 Tax=Cellulosimicrobium funkei TaxID=264251 RepID=UPI0036CC2EF4
MSEMGYQRELLPGWGDLANEAHETNPALVWPKSIDVFDKMRREDSQVGSVLRAVTFPIRRTTWMIDPAGARPTVTKLIAESFGLPIKGQPVKAPLRARDRFDFDEHLRLALLELVFGHSVFEQVYRAGDDGLVRLRKLAWRPPRTISKWDVAADGGLVAIEQHGIAGRKVRIPVDRLVVYVNEREGANWLGTSLLRTAYKNWLLKDRTLRAQAVGIERNSLGIPVYKGAPLPKDAEMTESQILAWAEAQKIDGLALVKALRSGQDAGASIPNGAELALMGVTGNRADTDKPIRYHDEQIARAVLAHFLNLGSETGSWALGSTFAEFFVGSLNAVALHIANTCQAHVVEDLVDANWGPNEPAPRIVPATIGEEQPATAEAIKSLIDCGAIEPDDELEQYIRQRYKLPVKDASTVRRMQVGAAGDAGSDMTDAERARFAAEVIQKIYLGVGPVIDKDEARAIASRAGADLASAEPEEAA